jgi:prepilin peptidase CpaA
MTPLSLDTIIYVVFLGIFTALATVWDLRTRRIPNQITVAVFVFGLLYQGIFHGVPGLTDAALGFAVGFGIFFTLWMLGSGGGGDVKLMGALGVCLGMKLTLYVVFTSTLFVLVGTVGVIAWSVMMRGIRGTKRKFGKKQITAAGRKISAQAREKQKQKRRIMAFALPATLATWLIVFLDLASIISGPIGN